MAITPGEIIGWVEAPRTEGFPEDGHIEDPVTIEQRLMFVRAAVYVALEHKCTDMMTEVNTGLEAMLGVFASYGVDVNNPGAARDTSPVNPSEAILQARPDGLKVSEAAELLGITPVAVRSRRFSVVPGSKPRRLVTAEVVIAHDEILNTEEAKLERMLAAGKRAGVDYSSSEAAKAG